MVCSLNRPGEGGFDPERAEVGMRGLQECTAVVVHQTRGQRIPLSGGAEERLWVKENDGYWNLLFFLVFSWIGVILSCITSANYLIDWYGIARQP